MRGQEVHRWEGSLLIRNLKKAVEHGNGRQEVELEKQVPCCRGGWEFGCVLLCGGGGWRGEGFE